MPVSTPVRDASDAAARREAERRLRNAARTAGVWGLLLAGRLDPRRRRRLALLRLAESVAAAQAMGRSLMSGRLDPAAWHARFAAWLIAEHRTTTLALLGRPGPGGDAALDLTPSQESDLGHGTTLQLGFLARFRAGVESKAVPLDGRIPVRSGLYARAAWGVAWGVVAAEAGRRMASPFDARADLTAPLHPYPPAHPGLSSTPYARGIRMGGRFLERRVLGDAHHCGDCPELADRGWVPYGTLPPIGATQCGPFCLCHFEYSRNPYAGTSPTSRGPGPQPRPQTQTQPQPRAPRPAPATTGTVPKFGPSQAEVVIRGDPQQQEKIRDLAARIFARPTTERDLASLAGAPDNVTVRLIQVARGERINAYTETPDWYSSTTFRRSATGSVIELDALEVMETSQGQGLARRIVGRMIESARGHGVERITLEAASGGPNVGYRVWPRMGFDGPIPAAEKARLPASLSGAERISDLYATPAGRAWWADNGGDVHLEFDLTAGSKSLRTWFQYLQSKK